MDQPRKWRALKRVTDTQSLLLHDAAMGRRAWGGGCSEALGVSLSETAPGADLGGSRPKWRRVSCEQQLDMG